MTSKNAYIWDILDNKNIPLKNNNIKNKLINVKHKIINTSSKLIKNIKEDLSKNIYLSTSNIPINTSTNVLPTKEYYNKYIYNLKKIAWLDASDLTSLFRDKYNNINKVLDKSGNNNHFVQNDVNSQPKYHNGSILFNNDQFLLNTNIPNIQTIIIICNQRGLNTLYPFDVYEIDINNQFIPIHFSENILTNTLTSTIEIYEVLIFDSIIDTTDKVMIKKYLLNKWDTVQNASMISLPNIFMWLDASSNRNYMKDKTNNIEFASNNMNYESVNNKDLNLNTFSIFIVLDDTIPINTLIFSGTNNEDNKVIFTITNNIVNNVITYKKKLYEFTINNNNSICVMHGSNNNLLSTVFVNGIINSYTVNQNVHELLIINNTISTIDRNKLYNYFSEKWDINLSTILSNNTVSYINQFIPRVKMNKTNKYIELNTIFTNETNLTISDTVDLSKHFNIQIPIALTDIFPNQLIIVDDELYLSPIDFGVIYNVKQYIDNGKIRLPLIPDNNIFAFKNVGNYEFYVNEILISKSNTIHYFIYNKNNYSYEENIDITKKLNVTLNKYYTINNNTFTAYLNGWMQQNIEIYVKSIINNQTYVITPEHITFDKCYQVNFKLLLPTGMYTISINNSIIEIPINITYNELYAEQCIVNNTCNIVLTNWSDIYNTITELDIYISDNKEFKNSKYLLTSEIKYTTEYICFFTNILENGFYWITLKDKNNIVNININKPIINYLKNQFIFTLLNPTHAANEFNIKLENWTDVYRKNTENIFVYANDILITTIDTNTINNLNNILTINKSELNTKLSIVTNYELRITDNVYLDVIVKNVIPAIEINAIINKNYGYVNNNNIFVITLSNNENLNLETYCKIWYVFVLKNNYFELYANTLLNNNTLTFMYNPLENNEDLNFYISNNNDYFDVKIFVNSTIYFYNISFNINNKNKYYTITLNGWSSNIDITTLYLFNTYTQELLTEVTNIYEKENEYYIDFKYEPQADYFVKALHKTTFDHLLISVIRVDSEDYYLK